MSDPPESEDHADGFLPDTASYLPSGPAPENFWTKVGALAGVGGLLVAVIFGLIELGVFSSPGMRTGPVTPEGDAASTSANLAGDPAVTSLRPTAEPAPATTPETQDQPADDEPPGATLSAGTCVDAESTPIDCFTSHKAQVYAPAEPCDLASFEQFVGLGDRDVLRPDVDTTWQEGVGCIASVDGQDLVGSLEVAFADPRGETAAQLRHCLDLDLGPTACGEPHHGEVVGHHADSQQCTAVALSYLGRDGGRFPAGDLAIAVRGDQCLVTVKGDNALSGTLRDIGRRSLPIEARS